MLRYLRLLGIAIRTSLLLALQYRWDFLGQGLMQLLFTALSALPLWIAFAARGGAAGAAAGELDGYTFFQALAVFGFFALLKAVLDGAIGPSLSAVVEHIRTGTLDFVLLKPADGQFLVSTARLEPWHVIDGMGGVALIILGAVGHARSGGATPGPGAVLGAAVLFLCGVALLYAVSLLVVCAAFYVVRIDNLLYLFTSLFDFARWPRSVFRGALHVLFTFILPLTLMTSYPADALLGALAPGQAAQALGWTALLLTLSRGAWRRALARYTSASS